MLIRRLIAIVIVLGTYMACFPSVKGEEVRVPLPQECPPQDVADWYYDSSAPHADRIEWIVASHRYFAERCYPEGLPPKYIKTACTWVWPDPIYGGYYAVIYAEAPMWAYPSYIIQHEACHAEGWRHSELYHMKFPPNVDWRR